MFSMLDKKNNNILLEKVIYEIFQKHTLLHNNNHIYLNRALNVYFVVSLIIVI